MKKLMIAAAAGAMAFATVAADCGCNTCDTCSTDCTYAYEFILLAKSTEGKPASTTVKSSCSCSCTTCSYGIYRKPRMRKYAGFIFGRVGSGSTSCASACGCLPFYSNANYTPAVLDGIEDEAFAPGYTAAGDTPSFSYSGLAGDYQMFWDVRTKQMVAACLEFDFIDAIGYQSRETVEAVGNWAIEQTVDSSNQLYAVGGVRLAGFGTRGTRGNGKIMIKNISGFFAGTLPCFATTISGTCACEQTSVIAPAFGWTVCSDVWLGTGSDYTGFLTAAYGKWTLKWNDTAAAHLRKNYSWTSLVKPGYATSGDVNGMQPEQDIAANLGAIKTAMEAEKAADAAN